MATTTTTVTDHVDRAGRCWHVDTPEGLELVGWTYRYHVHNYSSPDAGGVWVRGYAESRPEVDRDGYTPSRQRIVDLEPVFRTVRGA